MALLREEEYDHNQKKEQGAEDRYSLESEKVHLTREFVIMAKFGGYVLRHLASRLANVVRENRPKTYF